MKFNKPYNRTEFVNFLKVTLFQDNFYEDVRNLNIERTTKFFEKESCLSL
jgi:hypothetical protein